MPRIFHYVNKILVNYFTGIFACFSRLWRVNYGTIEPVSRQDGEK